MPCTESKQDKCRQGNANVTWCGKQRLGANREMYMEKDEERRYQGTSGLNLRSSSVHLARKQCDQIGLFLKVLGDKFSYQRSPNIWQLFEVISHFVSKLQRLLFVHFWKKWATFYSKIWSHCAQSQLLPPVHRNQNFNEGAFFWMAKAF